MSGFSAKKIGEKTINSNQNDSISNQTQSSASKSKNGSSTSSTSLLSSLTKASLGVESSRKIPDDIPDELLDKYVADLILQEAREKNGSSSKDRDRWVILK